MITSTAFPVRNHGPRIGGGRAWIIGFAVVGLAAIGCSDDVDGGSCAYADTPGNYVVTSVDNGSGECADQPTVINLAFEPNSADDADSFDDKFLSIRAVEGMTWSASCLADAALVVDGKTPGVRSDITSGTCGPRFYVISALEAKAAACELSCGTTSGGGGNGGGGNAGTGGTGGDGGGTGGGGGGTGGDGGDGGGTGGGGGAGGS